MVDLELLKKKMDDSGLKIIAIANKSKISRATLSNRLKGAGEFTATEIVSLTNTLSLTKEERDEIFLRQKLN